MLDMFLICHSFITRGQIDNSTIGEAMFAYVMLHDSIVPMGVNANVWVMGETEVHDAAEYSVSIGINAFATAFLMNALIVIPAFWAAIATPL
jgi:hypothetical protein